MMKHADIKTAVTGALAGKRKLRLTFSQDAQAETPFLLGMARNKILSLDNPMDAMVLMAVAQSKKWDGDRNRQVAVTLANPFDDEAQDWFVGRMFRALDKCEVVS